MARLLLVHPLLLAESPAEQASASPYFPLGLLSLAAYVRERGHDVHIYDGTFQPDRSTFDTALAAVDPDVVGVSGVLPTREAALDFAARSAAAGVPVIAGGPDPTAEPTAYLCGAVDVVVHHEGEQTITALLDRFDQGELSAEHLRDEPGLAFLDPDGALVHTPTRPPIEDLDALPDPARDLIDMERYLDAWEAEAGYRSMTVSVSRGCARGCKWCAAGVHGDGYRERTPADVAAEVKRLTETYRIDRLRFVDDVDAMDRPWFDEWAAAAEANGAAVAFEALNDLERTDLPLLDVRDSL
ncbi:MAG: cobalamin-dependent protein [Actinomycetota bacterium]